MADEDRMSEEASESAAAPPAPPAAAADALPSSPPPLPSSRSPAYNPLLNALKKKRAAKVAASRKVSKKIRDLDTNVFAVKLGFLGEDVSMATGDPIFCECGACLSSVDKLSTSLASLSPDGAASSSTSSSSSSSTSTSEASAPAEPAEPAEPADDPDRLYWRCAFCNKINSALLSEEEVPKESIVDYIREVPAKAENTEEKASVVFCIDVSGSMCVTSEIPGKVALRGNSKSTYNSFVDDNSDQFLPGQRRDVTYVSRLQSVQAAIAAQIETLSKQKPNYSVGLVTFNDEVTVIGDGQQHQEVIAGDKLHSYDELLKAGESYVLQSTIGVAEQALSSKVFALEEGGATALGPGLLVSVAIAAQTPGSKVVICTDGLANVGIGSLDGDGESKAAAERFYETIGLYAKTRGVSISVISIRGSEASLEQLGVLADLTSGTVDMVNPLEITSQFSAILSVPLVATHVNVKLILSPYMQARDEDTEAEASTLSKEIGNVTTESEALFEYTLKKGLEIPPNLSALPVQVQVHYTKMNGVKCVRVVSEAQPITRSREEAEAEADVSVLGVHAMKNAAVVAQKGDYSRARLYSANARVVLNRAAQKPVQQAEFASYARAHSRFESAIGNLQVAEQARGVYHDSASTDVAPNSSRKSARSDDSSRMLWRMKGINKARMEETDTD